MYKFIHEEQKAEGNLGRLLTAHHIKRVEIVVETDACLAEMCDAFQLFLKANGYNFEGNVEIVPEDGFEQDIVDYKSMQQDVTELNGDGNRERGAAVKALRSTIQRQLRVAGSASRCYA